MSEFVHVDLKTCNYTIHIGSGLLHKAGELLLPVLASRRVVVISDEIVASLYLTQLQNSLDLAGLSYSTIVIPPGEGSKSLEQLTLVLDQLLNYKIDRNTTVIALGGGVIGDLAGFAAAIALRGLPFIQVPTTLLALVDSSIGGKTGINSWHGKNMIGSFHQPRAVLADVSVLDTLPLRHLRSGYAEMVKYSAIANPAFFSWLEQHGTAVLNGDDKVQVEAIRVSCLCKAAIVSADEYELGQRALLNLGHTFGHALEAVTEFSDVLLHGEAVAIGMVLAFDLSVRLNLCPKEDANRLCRHFESVGLPTNLDQILRAQKVSIPTLLKYMFQDKKVKDGRIAFILVRGLGQAFIARNVEISSVESLLKDALTV